MMMTMLMLSLLVLTAVGESPLLSPSGHTGLVQDRDSDTRQRRFVYIVASWCHPTRWLSNHDRPDPSMTRDMFKVNKQYYWQREKKNSKTRSRCLVLSVPDGLVCHVQAAAWLCSVAITFKSGQDRGQAGDGMTCVATNPTLHHLHLGLSPSLVIQWLTPPINSNWGFKLSRHLNSRSHCR